MSAPLVVIGDVLLDRDIEGTAQRLCPDDPAPVVDEAAVRERPGGAGLAAYLAARTEPRRDVVLVTALGNDEASERLRALLATHVTLVELALDRPPAQKVRIRANGRTLVRLDRGGGTTTANLGEALPAAAEHALRRAGAVLVSDYGRGMAIHPRLRELLEVTIRRQGRPRLVWDPHPRGATPLRGTLLATPNLSEAGTFAGGDGRAARERDAPALRAAQDSARALVTRWRCRAVAVTLGDEGALLSTGGDVPLLVPAPAHPAAGDDPCGAGDSFAAHAAAALAGGALPSEAVHAAVAGASRFVTNGGASSLDLTSAPALEDTPDAVGDPPGGAAAMVARTRAAGGTVVAAGGCFDVLHAGHVAMLRAARTLGDCLIVCLNSDASVQRLKGHGRPVNSAADRAAVLGALGCVDAVEVFDEDTPEAALTRLRPDVWAKGGDYGDSELPETTLVASWGGQTVVLPYTPGRSTTRTATALTARPGTG